MYSSEEDLTDLQYVSVNFGIELIIEVIELLQVQKVKPAVFT